MTRVLVTGGRNYLDQDRIAGVLADIQPTCVIHGDATGADRLAKIWCLLNNVPQEPYPALWGKHGRAAGPIRNQQMLECGHPDLVVAFPGGSGTADMVARARKAGIPVQEVTP